MIENAAVIFAHNHPSGDLQPSEADLKTQEQLEGAAKILGIHSKLFDSVHSPFLTSHSLARIEVNSINIQLCFRVRVYLQLDTV